MSNKKNFLEDLIRVINVSLAVLGGYQMITAPSSGSIEFVRGLVIVSIALSFSLAQDIRLIENKSKKRGKQ